MSDAGYDDYDDGPMLCDATGMYCSDPTGNWFCEDYGCVKACISDARAKRADFNNSPLGRASLKAHEQERQTDG